MPTKERWNPGKIRGHTGKTNFWYMPQHECGESLPVYLAKFLAFARLGPYHYHPRQVTLPRLGPAQSNL